MKDNYILIEIRNEKLYSVIKTLTKYNIYYSNLNINENKITLLILNEDYEKIKKLFKKQTRIIKYTGTKAIKEFIKKHYLFIISIIVSYIIILTLSNLCFGINVETNNKELKQIILKELESYEVKKYNFKKSYDEITELKEKILENNKDKLEWLEITENGVYYNISLTERIIKNEEAETDEIMDIVSQKDALIKKVILKNGTNIKYVNEYVKKGDVIISGDILKNDEVVSYVKPDGEVYGEVWYTVTTTVPYNFIEYVSTGDIINHYYIEFLNSKMTLLGKYDYKNVFVTQKVLIDKPYIFFRLIKEEKEVFEYKELSLNKEEAYEEAIRRSDKSINAKLTNEEYIIDKKVLKKNEFSSKIEIEVFYRVYESIGKLEKRIIDEVEEE